MTQTRSAKRWFQNRFWIRRIPLLIILALLVMAAWQLRERNSTPVSAQGGEPS